MRNTSEKKQISNKLFSLFTTAAINSSSTCNNFIWQQAKAPKCLLEREVKDSNMQN